MGDPTEEIDVPAREEAESSSLNPQAAPFTPDLINATHSSTEVSPVQPDTAQINALSLSLQSPTTSPPKPPPQPALRRTASTLSSGSNSGTGREKKRLRFTQMIPSTPAPPSPAGSGMSSSDDEGEEIMEGGEEDEKGEGGVFFPGSSKWDLEQGGGKVVGRPRGEGGYRSWEKSDPGTPNLAET